MWINKLQLNETTRELTLKSKKGHTKVDNSDQRNMFKKLESDLNRIFKSEITIYQLISVVSLT